VSIVERVLSERDRARRTITAGSVAIAVGALGAALTLGAVVLGRGRWLALPSAAPFVQPRRR
jgi:hypothetical protein